MYLSKHFLNFLNEYTHDITFVLLLWSSKIDWNIHMFYRGSKVDIMKVKVF